MHSLCEFCFIQNVFLAAYHSGRSALGMNRLRPLEHTDHGFEFHLRYGCLFAFILYLRCSVCRLRPCEGLIPRPRSPTHCV
jgi:hypothetical protein